jgi:hypothetical protein
MKTLKVVSDFQIGNMTYAYMSNGTIRVFDGVNYNRTICPNTCEFQAVIYEALKIGFKVFYHERYYGL